MFSLYSIVVLLLFSLIQSGLHAMQDDALQKKALVTTLYKGMMQHTKTAELPCPPNEVLTSVTKYPSNTTCKLPIPYPKHCTLWFLNNMQLAIQYYGKPYAEIWNVDTATLVHKDHLTKFTSQSTDTTNPIKLLSDEPRGPFGLPLAVYDTSEKRELFTLPPQTKCASLPTNNQYVASLSLRGTLDTWDISSGNHLKSFSSTWKNPSALQCSPQGSLIAIVHQGKTVSIVDVEHGTEKTQTFNAYKGIDACTFLSETELVVSYIDNEQHTPQVKIWNIETNDVYTLPTNSCSKSIERDHRLHASIRSICCSPDGSYVVLGTSPIEVHKIPNKKQLSSSHIGTIIDTHTP